MTKDELQDAARRMVLYFEPGVLAAYRQESHRYDVRTDNFEGEIRIRSDFYAGLTEEQQSEYLVTAQFGFRAMADGTLAVAVWGPDVIEKTSEAQRGKWAGFQIPADRFPADFDPRFDLWMQRQIAGNWYIDDGPLRRLVRVVTEINALSREALAVPLFRAEETADLLFPAAESDAAYRAAHAAVHRLIFDGLDKRAIEALAKAIGKPLTIKGNETANGLRSLLDAELQVAVLDPLKVVSNARNRSAHGAQAPAATFGAFDQFSKDMDAVVSGLGVFKSFVANSLKLDVRRCMERQEKLKHLPKLDVGRPPGAAYSIVKATKIVGKTVARVESGFRQRIAGVHDSEVLLMHFTDGGALAIETGSNAGNLSQRPGNLAPEDFHCDLILTFVPAAIGQASEDDEPDLDDDDGGGT